MKEKIKLPVTVTAPVVHGRGLGHKLGAPTVNQVLTAENDIPFGVYFSRCTVGGVTYDAVTNVGVKPTVTSDGRAVCETHLLDCDCALYGLDAETELLFFRRREEKFPSEAALAGAISEDIAAARQYFKNKSV